MNNFSPSNTDFRVSLGAVSREITNWGTASPPLVIEYIDASGNLIRGEGGGAVALYRDNPGVRITVNLLAGSPDSAFLKAGKTSRATITATHTVIGTLEAMVATEGIFVNEGQWGRAGTSTVSDDVYIMEFNTEDSSKGGDA